MSDVYVPKYTSVDAIARKLNYRLKIASSQTTLPNQFNSQSLAKTAVENELLFDVIQENEETLDEYLGIVYVLPLQKRHAILKRCVDSLCMADLMQYHFTIAGYSESQDISGFGVANRQEAYQIIRALTHGYNTAIPMIGPEYIRQNPVQPIRLAGEQFLANRQDKYLPTDQYTIIGGIKKSNSISDIRFSPETCSRDQSCGTPVKKSGKVDEDVNETCAVFRPY